MLIVKEKELKIGIERAYATCPETKDECYCCVQLRDKGYVTTNVRMDDLYMNSWPNEDETEMV